MIGAHIMNVRDIGENALEGCMIYPEHNDEYLQECLDNLKGKGIDLCQVL